MPFADTLPAAIGAGSTAATMTILGLSDADAQTRSFDELITTAGVVATGIAERGVDRGEAVALLARTTFDFVVGCLAVWRRGAVVVSLPYQAQLATHDAWQRHVQALIRSSKARLVLRGAGDPPIETEAHTVDAASLLGGGTFTDAAPAPSDVALMQFTSGSTSAPKGIVLDHRSVIANLEALGNRLDPPVGQRDIYFSWLPLYHDLGFINYFIRPLINGWDAIMMPTELFAREPLRWAIEISNRQATACSAPNSAFGLLAREIDRSDRTDMDLSRWRYAGNGGETVGAGAMAALVRAGARIGFPEGTPCPGYGLAEVTCTASARAPGTGWIVDRVDRNALVGGRAEPASGAATRVATIVSVGRLLEGIEGRIVGDDGEPLGDRGVGEILLRSPSVMRGYLDDPTATSRVLHDGWLRTGDRGYFVDGELFITGRSKDVIVVNGQNYHAEDIEQVIDGVPGIRRGNCIAVAIDHESEESLAVLAETKALTDEDVDATRSAIVRSVLDNTGIAPARVLMLAPRSVPKTTSGKLRRAEAKKMLELGLFSDKVEGADSEQASPPPVDAIESALARIWEDVLGVAPIGRDDDFFALGGTSMHAIAIVARIAKTLDSDLPASALLTATTVAALAEVIRSAGGFLRMPLMLPLQLTGAGDPLFCVHGGGGSVFSLYTLARYLSETHPLYALQARGSDGREKPDESVEEMAARYLGEIRGVQPPPHLLMGYSFGGVVVYEMARQLEAAGEEIAVVMLLDAPPPDPLPGGMFGLWMRSPRLAAWRTLYGTRRQTVHLAGRIQMALQGRLPAARLRRFMLYHSRKLLNRYEPETPYGGRVDYIRVVDEEGTPTSELPELWRELAPGGLVFHDITGPSHTDALEEPHVKNVVAILEDIIGREEPRSKS